MAMTNLIVEFIERIDVLEAAHWQSLVGNDNPFVSYDYLHALESSGAVGEDTGWLTHHLLARDTQGTLLAAVPLYLKNDSWGEFVFDFAWADAYHRHGVPYYPKLVTAVPYTPVPGPRLLCQPHVRAELVPQLVSAIQAEAESRQCSSWHVLFPQDPDLPELQKLSREAHGSDLSAPNQKMQELTRDDSDAAIATTTPAPRQLPENLIVRKDCQFHWFNNSYCSFDHYLERFRASRRKKCRRERRKVQEAGISIAWRSGHDMTPSEWESFYELYASSFYKRGRSPYFALDFFTRLAKSTQINMQIVFAQRDNQNIAAAMFFVTEERMYGRYWGCREFVDGLHFELCYYQGIEYCIEHNIKQFDPGVQGEHKIARGFQATPSWSVHWLKLPPFAHAIAAHIDRELEHVDAYMEEVDQHLPFRRENPHQNLNPATSSEIEPGIARQSGPQNDPKADKDTDEPTALD